MANAIRHAPTYLGGAGFRQIYLEQGILMVQQLHKYFNSPHTTIGKLLSMTMSWTQAFVGTSKNILNDTGAPIPPVGHSYLLDMRTFLKTINGKFQLDNPQVPKLLRRHDRHIMDIVMAQTQWTERHIIQINSCRRYLQAQTLSDITTITGTRILPNYINGNFLATSKNV